MESPRITVVGLGPGDQDLITAGAIEVLASVPHRYVRTLRHPAARIFATKNWDVVSFDEFYEQSENLESVYESIVSALIGFAQQFGHVVYVVPGSPVVAERTVELLQQQLEVPVEVLPALSFLDLSWPRLGIDPVAQSARVIDGHRFAVQAAGERGPLLVAQCDNAEVLSEIKLALDAGYEPSMFADSNVIVLQRLGLPDEKVYAINWLEMDRIEPDHLTSIWIPHLAAPIARELSDFVELVNILREQCPWDAEQTHESLRRHLLEESYEVLEAIDQLTDDAESYENLAEELGDLLFQILFHARLAAEQGQFTVADVAKLVNDKLRSRHPHVFPESEMRALMANDGQIDDASDVVRNWEQIKKAEKGRESVFDGVPDAIPALLFALKVQSKANVLGETVPMPEKPNFADALAAFSASPDDHSTGELLFALVDEIRRVGIDPETALRATAVHYRNRARSAELEQSGN